MDNFSYKGGCGVCECTCFKAFKIELAWGTDKQLWVNSNKMLFKLLYIPLRK